MGKTIISADGRFEWEEDKSRINKKLHGLYFNEILPAFDDPYLLEMYDETHSASTEVRFRGLAELQDFIILYPVIHRTIKRPNKDNLCSACRTNRGAGLL